MFQEEELYRFEHLTSLKFIRRADVSSELRLHIACTVICYNDYGTVTNLAKKYKVSRPFIYYLKNQLLISGWAVFGMLAIKATEAEQDSLEDNLIIAKEILSLRLEGKCALLGISSLLKRRGMKKSSLGYISELLSGIGNQLSATIEQREGITYEVVFASDEVFSSGVPVLITVDPVSSAILHIQLGKDRTGVSWAAHFQGLLNQGIVPLYLVSDDGVGLKAGRQAALSKLVHQTDTFHAVAHRLGDLCRLLEEQAYKAIEEEYKCEGLYARAVKDSNKAKRHAQYQAAKAKSKDLIKLYVDFAFWYEFAIEQFQMFDKNGIVLEVSEAQENLNLALKEIGKLEWFKKAKNEKMKKTIDTIKGLSPNLFHFLERAKNVVNPLLEKASCENERLADLAICKAYQHQKNRLKATNYNSKKYHELKENEALIMAQFHLECTLVDFKKLHKELYKQLDTVVQSSAMVETINSIVRPYFNCSKNQISQAQLNLIMFYHNHRRYVQGKRKGYTPMELLTGEKQQEDWLDLLLAKVTIKAATAAVAV